MGPLPRLESKKYYQLTKMTHCKYGTVTSVDTVAVDLLYLGRLSTMQREELDR